MLISGRLHPISAVLLAAWLCLPSVAMACATCFGAVDDPISTSVKMAVVSLIATTALVLGGIGAFMIHLARRARAAQLSSGRSGNNHEES